MTPPFHPPMTFKQLREAIASAPDDTVVDIYAYVPYGGKESHYEILGCALDTNNDGAVILTVALAAKAARDEK